MDTNSRSRVYFTGLPASSTAEEASSAGRRVLERMIQDEKVKLESAIPLKVHFGEKGNRTFLGPEVYEGIRDFLAEKSITSAYIETNVLYAGQRCNRTLHLRTAEEHGFTQLPVIIADGQEGEEYTEVPIRGNHFSRCRLGKAFSDYEQIIVLSHFKGHRMAGFGGALKQLAMGFASRAGKMDQHANAVPFVIPFKCIRCGACVRYCPEKAISMGFLKASIDARACVGCAGCIAKCPKNAILPNFLKSFSGAFVERIAEYALAAHQGRRNLYVSFGRNITRGCDCEGSAMKLISPDMGVLASLDPVALDQACLDRLRELNKGKDLLPKAAQTLEYAQEIGLGSREYDLVELE